MYLIAAKDTFLLLLLYFCSPRAGIAQLVERPIEKPGAILSIVTSVFENTRHMKILHTLIGMGRACCALPR